LECSKIPSVISANISRGVGIAVPLNKTDRKWPQEIWFLRPIYLPSWAKSDHLSTRDSAPAMLFLPKLTSFDGGCCWRLWKQNKFRTRKTFPFFALMQFEGNRNYLLSTDNQRGDNLTSDYRLQLIIIANIIVSVFQNKIEMFLRLHKERHSPKSTSH